VLCCSLVCRGVCAAVTVTVTVCTAACVCLTVCTIIRGSCVLAAPLVYCPRGCWLRIVLDVCVPHTVWALQLAGRRVFQLAWACCVGSRFVAALVVGLGLLRGSRVGAVVAAAHLVLVACAWRDTFWLRAASWLRRLAVDCHSRPADMLAGCVPCTLSGSTDLS
jgi:hypothetical protein